MKTAMKQSNSITDKLMAAPAGLLKVTSLSAAVLLASCSSLPEQNSDIVALETRYQVIASQADASQQANSELAETRATLEDAKVAYKDRDEEALAHYLFVADKTLDVAEARIDLYSTNNSIAEASENREKMVLASREHELQLQERRLNNQQALLSAQENVLDQQSAQLSEKEAMLQQKQRELNDTEARLTESENEAADLAERLEEVTAKVNERGTVLVMSDIVFDFGSAELKPGSERAITEIAGFLNDQESQSINIEGHTDSVGSDSFNDTLSRERAAAVKEALVRQGVSQDRLETSGMGEEYPVATNDTDEGRLLNRRVEIVIGNDETSSPVASTISR